MARTYISAELRRLVSDRTDQILFSIFNSKDI